MVKTALVTGISDASLKATVPEAERWDGLLRNSFGFTTTLWRNSQVTLDAVILKLEGLLDAAKAGDEIVFVYCGHGDTLSAGGGVGEEALLLYDKPLRETRFGTLVKDHYRLGEFTVVLETCFSGGFGTIWPVKVLDGILALFGFAWTKFASPAHSRAFQESFEVIRRFSDATFLPVEQKRPLMIAACGPNEYAAQSPTGPRLPLHMRFSKKAIPYLAKNPSVTHRQFHKDVAPTVKRQHVTFNGDLNRIPNLFFT